MVMAEINEQIEKNPPTYEEAKSQFEELTEKLGLRHTFTFDEMYQIGMELRRKKEFRDKVDTFHQQLEDGGGIVGEELNELNPLEHTFVGGCYIRKVINPANELLVTKIHKIEHPFFLMRGKMSILTEDGVKTIEAPYNGVTKVGTKRIIYTHEECEFITVHPTDKTTPEEVEEDVIAKDFNDYQITQGDIDQLIKELE